MTTVQWGGTNRLDFALSKRIGEHGGDGMRKAGYHVLPVERIIDREHGDRPNAAARVPHINLAPVGPHYPYQGCTAIEVGSRLRGHIVGLLIG